jgi:hypothetical protein
MTTTTAEKTIQDSLDSTSAALLFEHERLALLYQHNVTMGDQFVAAYLGALSVAVALLVGMRELIPESSTLVLVEFALLVIILVVGAITFRRLIERRIRSIEYLRAINRIHRYFADRDPKVQQYFYWPVCDDCPPMHAKGTVLGGLRDIVAGLNSLFFGFAGSVITKTWWPTSQYLVLVLVGIAIAVIVWFIQHKFSEDALNRADQEMNKFILFPQPKQQS